MPRFFVSHVFLFAKRGKSSLPTAPRRQVRPKGESLEARDLLTSLAPKSLLIYYGYPSLINAAPAISQAASFFGAYDDVVLGDGLEAPSHPDHDNTVHILSNPALAHTNVFGYVDLGVSTQNLSISQMEIEISQWKSTGATGILLDDFGYDFGTTRARQDIVVQYAHSLGLAVVANAYVPADAFSAQLDPVHNPSGSPTSLNANDYYLYESYQVVEGNYDPVSEWRSKAGALASFQSAIGFKVLVTTTNNIANVFDQNKFDYAWYSALEAGYAAVSWGEYDYAANNCMAPLRIAPEVNAGSTFTGGVIQNGVIFTRNTDLGQIQVNTATHTGSFTTLPVAPTLSATPVSASRINLSWTAASGATGYVVYKRKAWGLWGTIATLKASKTSYAVTGLDSGSYYSFKIAVTNAVGTVFTTVQTVETITAPPTFVAKAVSSNQIKLSWTNLAGASGYIAQELINGSWAVLGTFRASTKYLAVTRLQHRTTYTFRIGAIDAAGTAFSAPQRATTN